MDKAVEVLGVIRAIMNLDEQLQCSIPDQIHDVLAILFHAQPSLSLALSDRSFSLTTLDSDSWWNRNHVAIHSYLSHYNNLISRYSTFKDVHVSGSLLNHSG
jgi:hypothetical protein